MVLCRQLKSDDLIKVRGPGASKAFPQRGRSFSQGIQPGKYGEFPWLCEMAKGKSLCIYKKMTSVYTYIFIFIYVYYIYIATALWIQVLLDKVLEPVNHLNTSTESEGSWINRLYHIIPKKCRKLTLHIS